MKIFYPLTCILLLLFTACGKDSNNLSNPGNGNGKGGSMARFAINASHLYVANTNALKTYDISGDGLPVLKDSLYIGMAVETIFAYDDKLFVGSANAMYIYSLDNPAKPVMESQSQHFRACDPVVSQGSTAYVTLRGGSNCGGILNALMVYNVTDIKQPQLLKTLPLSGPYGLGVQDSALYVCDGKEGLVIYNIKDQHDPKVLKRIKGDEKYIDVIPYNGVLIAYVEGGVQFFDITKPQDPQLLSALSN